MNVHTLKEYSLTAINVIIFLADLLVIVEMAILPQSLCCCSNLLW